MKLNKIKKFNIANLFSPEQSEEKPNLENLLLVD